MRYQRLSFVLLLSICPLLLGILYYHQSYLGVLAHSHPESQNKKREREILIALFSSPICCRTKSLDMQVFLLNTKQYAIKNSSAKRESYIVTCLDENTAHFQLPFLNYHQKHFVKEFISSTRNSVWVSSHLVIRQKYSTTRCIFNFLFRVWYQWWWWIQIFT